ARAQILRSDINDQAGVDLVGDASVTAALLTEALSARHGSQVGYRTPGVLSLLERSPEYPFADQSGSGTVDPRAWLRRVNQLVPRNRCVAIDSGYFMILPAQLLDVPEPHALVFSQAFMSVGLGLAGAAGAAVARPDVPTIAVVGDGGLMMSLG